MTIPGVKGVRFQAADPPRDSEAPKARGARKVVVFSDEAGLTKDAAVQALGKKAARYVVQSWTAPGPETADEAAEG